MDAVRVLNPVKVNVSDPVPSVDASIVRLPEESRVNLASIVLSVWVSLSCSVVESTSSLASGVASPIPRLPVPVK